MLDVPADDDLATLSLRLGKVTEARRSTHRNERSSLHGIIVSLPAGSALNVHGRPYRPQNCLPRRAEHHMEPCMRSAGTIPPVDLKQLRDRNCAFSSPLPAPGRDSSAEGVLACR
jgi:hypothetical protein